MKILENMSVRKKQLLMLFIVAVLGAAAGIIHGIFFDLDFSQIRRLSVFGIIFTSFIVFPAILFFEYIFDWNNNEEIRLLAKRIERLEEELKDRPSKV